MSLTENKIGSYSEKDVIFLLKDLKQANLEGRTEEREAVIQSGIHYSESLPKEKLPSQSYLSLFHESLAASKREAARLVSILSERILNQRGKNIVLVSLARAGTPVGILIKRYIAIKYGIELPHYSVSIIRGRGIDANAIKYICSMHPLSDIQFIDGWTGKGAIQRELTRSVDSLNDECNLGLKDSLAVLCDPGDCAALYGTKKDFFLPSSCLNATVSGLISRTVLNQQYISSDDFHGAKYYREWMEHDLSIYFIDEISSQFPEIIHSHPRNEIGLSKELDEPGWKGIQDVLKIQKEFKIDDTNLIKPGIGETTRVLLRRMPWKILIGERGNESLNHILMLAEERKVPVEYYEGMSYACCGIIQSVKGV
ncbi:cysteine protease StiP family protein [Falsibacillus pallidus]|uniref:RNA binding Pelota-like protein n=1 Tax=Falsibacillus pallidus TaxID=493781 RepID=A0A370GQD2_9BACI|nr:cysteine protease StiP family protein [Falsibacillus pallidus]RDI45935.1 RNA binding Pelota-like protein [Falsibacillus pallidus]